MTSSWKCTVAISYPDPLRGLLVYDAIMELSYIAISYRDPLRRLLVYDAIMELSYSDQLP